jgi:glutamine amidotransferase
MKPRATIVDYGSGNLLSVERALEHCGAEVLFARTPADIVSADILILPGVGAFADGMQGLRERGFVEPIQQHALSAKPLLGICLGMQMLATSSCEFGEHAGLGLIRGRVVQIPGQTVAGERQKIPQIGWATLKMPPNRSDWSETLLANAGPAASMYLVHSFYFRPDDPADVLANYVYGGHAITAAVKRGNITGVQFHPEKSAKSGLGLLAAFLRP